MKRKWTAKEFADRWFLQANYPLVRARMTKNPIDNKFYLNIYQERFISEYSIYSDDQIYPSPFDNVWYIPLNCIFGRSPNDPNVEYFRFDIDTRNSSHLIGDGLTEFKWMHCDEDFAGFYHMDYNIENWESLGDVLRAKNENFEAEDRANIIHNLFMNSFAGKTSYQQVVDVLEYLTKEKEYVPWRTTYIHANRMANVLEHRKSFFPVSVT